MSFSFCLAGRAFLAWSYGWSYPLLLTLEPTPSRVLDPPLACMPFVFISEPVFIAMNQFRNISHSFLPKLSDYFAIFTSIESNQLLAKPSLCLIKFGAQYLCIVFIVVIKKSKLWYIYAIPSWTWVCAPARCDSAIMFNRLYQWAISLHADCFHPWGNIYHLDSISQYCVQFLFTTTSLSFTTN